MTEATIVGLLESAEKCNERGLHKMAKMALLEIFRYIDAEVPVSDDTWDRIQALDDKYEDDGDYNVESEEPDENGNVTCNKCNGTGKYGNGRVCYACKGKKFQDPSDRERNNAYWEHQERMRELRKRAPLSDF